MFHILHRGDQRKGAIAAVEFEGKPYGAGVSFFQGNLPPGKGPGLHQDPYSETCIVLSGQAAMVVDGEEVVANAGNIVVMGPATPEVRATSFRPLEDVKKRLPAMMPFYGKPCTMMG